MIGNRFKKIMIVLLITPMLSLILMGGLPSTNQQDQGYSIATSAGPMVSITNNSDWHAGSNVSTSLVNLTYSEQYSVISQPINNNVTQMGLLQQYMWLQYKDGTDARVGFELHCVFYPGGINVSEQKVLDWSKLYNIELILHSENWENNRTIGTMYSFEGFSIVKGNASNVTLSNVSEGSGSYAYYLNNVVGSISFWTDSARIGAVTLMTGADNESIATFNVTLASTINNGSPLGGYSANETVIPISTVFQFTVSHNLSTTEYKYGANIDWSSAKEFPTQMPLAYGEKYSLVARDLLMFYAGGTNGEVKQFSTDAGNDTALYSMNNQTMGRELFTKSYTMDNGTQAYNTSRIYVKDSSHDLSGNVSSVYVVFSGFSYGQSFKLSFDPAVVTQNSVKNSGSVSAPGTMLPYIAVIAVIAIAAVIVLWYRRR